MMNEGGKNTQVDLGGRTKMFALGIVQLYVKLPKSAEVQVIGKQLLRSGTSVGANYREANRGRSKKEFISKLGDCLKELDETAYWLELLIDSNLFHRDAVIPILDECNQLIAIFTTISKKSKANLE